jgi:excisionase family DNA binding protein
VSALGDMPAVLTVEEAGRVLRLGRTSAYQAVRAGEIPSIKVGRSLRVPTARLAELLGDTDPTNATSPAATPGPAQDSGWRSRRASSV